MDPRLHELGVSPNMLEEQVSFATEVRDLLSQARKKLDQLEEEKDPPASVEHQIKKLETRSGRYQQPRLIDQISYLYYNSIRADQEIGQDAKDRLKELKSQLESMSTD